MKTNGNDLVDLHGNNSPADPRKGLTKREYFAALAMQGWIMSPGERCDADQPFEMCAEYSLKYADALIKELNKDIK